jgi:hypothetical protein
MFRRLIVFVVLADALALVLGAQSFDRPFRAPGTTWRSPRSKFPWRIPSFRRST